MKLNKTQTDQLTAIAETNDMSLDDITARFEVIFNRADIAKREGKARSQGAMRTLIAKLAKKKDKASFGGKSEDIMIRVEMKEEPTEFKKKDGKKGFRSSIYCTADTGKDTFFGVLTLWNDANEINPNLVVGETYATKAIINGRQLSMNNPEEITSIADKLPPMSDLITESYPVVELSAIELNVSEDWNDLKLVKGVIAGAWAITTKSDTMMGFLKIIDEDDSNISMVAKFSKMYEQVDLWDDGSLVYVLGQITEPVYDEETGDIKFEASAWGNLIVPIDAFEKIAEDSDDEDTGDFADTDDEDEFSDEDEDFGLDDDEDWD